MTQAIRSFSALPPVERWLLVQAMAALPLMSLALRTIGLRRCYLALQRLVPARGECVLSERDGCHRGTQIGRLVRVAATHGLIRGSCLAQSLTIWWLLRRQGIPASLRIGVRKHNGRLEAHAWTEHQHRVLNDDANIAMRFSPFGGDGGVFETHGAGTQ